MVLDKVSASTSKTLKDYQEKSSKEMEMFVKKLSLEVPVLYGLFSIVSAIILGVAAAFIRRFLSNLRKKYFQKTA